MSGSWSNKSVLVSVFPKIRDQGERINKKRRDSQLETTVNILVRQRRDILVSMVVNFDSNFSFRECSKCKVIGDAIVSVLRAHLRNRARP